MADSLIYIQTELLTRGNHADVRFERFGIERKDKVSTGLTVSRASKTGGRDAFRASQGDHPRVFDRRYPR